MELKNVFYELFFGLFAAFMCFVPLCGAVLSTHYIAERNKKNDTSYFEFAMLIIVILCLASSANGNYLSTLPSIYSKVAFGVISIPLLYALIHIGITIYQDYGGSKEKWTIVVAAIIAVYIIVRIFVPSTDDRHTAELYKEEISESDYLDGYNDGISDWKFLRDKVNEAEDHLAHAIAMMEDFGDFALDDIYDELIKADNILTDLEDR